MDGSELSGFGLYRTPNVDRLAKEGIRFTNGYAAVQFAPLPVPQFKPVATHIDWV